MKIANEEGDNDSVDIVDSLISRLNDMASKDYVEFRRVKSETRVRQNMGRTFLWLATKMMVKILSDADSRRQCTRDRFESGESNVWRGKTGRIRHEFAMEQVVN
jgi:hypothetical protein